MKKMIVALMALVFAAPSFAQLSSGGFSLDNSTLYYGFRLGMNLSNLTGEDVAIGGVKSGFNIGGVVGLHLSETSPVMLESGLYYSERGAKDGKERVNYQNIEIPLLVKYGFALNDQMSILPYFGPVFARACWGKTKQRTLGGSLETVGTFDEKKAVTGGLNRANLGLKFGCGVEYTNIYAEAGYFVGLTNVCKSGKLNSEGTLHSNAFYVNIGVNF